MADPDQGGLPLIFERGIRACWCLVKWGLPLSVIAAAVAAAYVYYRADEEVRSCVQQRIAQHYTGLKVTIRSAELVEGEGIEVRGLSILEPGAEGPRAELLHCDEVFLHCATELPDLLRRELQVKRITIRRPTLCVTRRPDGTWSAASLLPLPKLSEHPPEVLIQNGTVEVFDPLKTPSSTLTLRQINGTLSPPDLAGPNPQARRFRGTLSADHMGPVELEGAVDSGSLQWTIGGTIEGLDFSPELVDALPGPLAGKLTELRQLRGQGTLSFQVSHDPAAESPYRFDVSGRIVRARLDDPRLPRPLTDLEAGFRISNEGLAVSDLVARSGPAALRVVSARQAGFELGSSPLWIEAEVRQLELDRQLLECLPEPLKEQWRKYSPAGQVDADVRLHFDGKAWHPDVSARCLNVSLAYYKFPYLLEHAKGTLRWQETPQGDLLAAHLTAFSSTQEVRLDAEVLNPTSGSSGWFEANAEDLQVDKKLLDAISPESRDFVSSLNPSGTAGFQVRIWRDVPGGPLHKHFVIGLNRCSIRYEGFPYPLSNVRGTLVMRDDDWTFDDLEGTNDTGRIVCQQGWLTSPERGRELFLRLVGTSVPLEEELRDALHADAQRAWNGLRPQGTVDLVAELHYRRELNKLSVSVTASPRGDGTSIEPVNFPYRLQKLRGVLAYQDGRVTLSGSSPGQRFKAEHGATKLATTGYCDFNPDGRWSLRLERLTADGLGLDNRELIQALPDRLKKTMAELKPSGSVNLYGSLTLEGNVEGNAGASQSVNSGWNLTVVFRPGASIDCGVKLQQLSGSVTLAGAADAEHFYSRGELAIDSLTWKDYQLTQVMGPLWIDERQVLLGSWVDRQRAEGLPNGSADWQPRPLTARLLGGNVYGDGWIMLGPEPQYGLRASLSQADLARFAQEAMVGRQNLRGAIAATVDLRGSGRSLNDLKGQGTIQLRNGDVYELPLMIALLKILSIRPPDQTAFSTSDVDFRIEGEHVYFDRINFNGDAISLLGRGQMDFQQKIQMTFYTIVGRGNLNIPLVRELFSGASQQIMQIHAEGTLQDPEIRREPFPIVGQALQLLQEDLQRGAGLPPRFPQAMDWMPDANARIGDRR